MIVSTGLIQRTEMGEALLRPRLTWALEEHGGERHLHVKAVFPQPTDPAGLVSGAKAVFAVELTNDPATARRSNSESEAR